MRKALRRKLPESRVIGAKRQIRTAAAYAAAPHVFSNTNRDVVDDAERRNYATHGSTHRGSSTSQKSERRGEVRCVDKPP
ncbi:unnamed protein product [Caenorhabditis auriculariae]|uniref:Uncharacterized protein n=1 Tax=Caenorhabditis auriculariae TaxID=2777116 RepID=A0A8S1H4S7_9PELO|nr:unnamed protein product [Caenorhabditis auriculariae]